MSEDERMERAERIRKLRGQGDGAGPDDSPDEAESSTGEDDGSPGDTDDGDTAGAEATSADPGDGDARNGDASSTAAPAGSPGSGGSAAQAAGTASGFELPDEGEMAAALGDETAAEATPAEPGVGQTARGQAATTVTEAHTRLLEFELGDERYCIDIAGVEEIVKRETVTRVPNTPDYVEGVVDLRGQITTILDAKGLLDIDADGPESLIVVFSPDAYEDQGAVGWIVDEVRQVRPVTEDQVRTPPTDDDYVEGVVDREEADELIVWVRPEAAMELAVGEDEDR